MDLEQFRIFLTRYANNKANSDERQLYDDFFETYQQVDDATAFAGEEAVRKDRIFSQVVQQVSKKPTIIRLPVFIRVAAALLLLLGAGLTIYHYRSTTKLMAAFTGMGERRDVRLSDGTLVTLNAGSRLTYPQTFEGDDRTVSLEGEAFFNVARDTAKPFIIHTAALQTTVLGTSFNITAYKGESNVVTVLTGKVKVAGNKGGNAVVLHPGQQASESAGGQYLAVKTVEAANYTAWENGTIYLDGIGLEALARRLERKYKVSIQIPPSLQANTCLFNGKLMDDKLQHVLEHLHFMSKLEYKMVNDSTVFINNVSCN